MPRRFFPEAKPARQWRSSKRIAAVLVLALSATGLPDPVPAQSAEGHGLLAEDLVSLRRMTAPQVSPAGDQLAFVIRSRESAGENAGLDIWIRDLGAEGQMRQMTVSPARDINPRWAADGSRLYFLSDRSGSFQIWAMPLGGGEPVQVSNLPVDITDLSVSHAGGELFFAADVFPDCSSLLCTAAARESAEKSPRTGRVYERLPVRFWDRWRDNTEKHLFTATLSEDGLAISEPVDVSRPLSGDVPEQPFGNSADIAWSADGAHLYFSLKIRDANESWSVDSNLYRVNVDGSGDPLNLTGDNPGEDTRPAISPDGRWLAWLSTSGAQNYAAQKKIRLMDLATGEVSDIAAAWDRSPDRILFSADSQYILARAFDQGTRSLFRIRLAGGEPIRLVRGGTVGGFAATADGVIYLYDDLANPADLYQVAINGDKMQRLTDINGDVLADVQMGTYRQFSFSGGLGDQVSGYVVAPVDFDPQRRYPVALIIHGGPHGSMGDQFHYRWNPQVYAAHGYGVVYIDFHGSRGYGQAFLESIMGDRGGLTLEDHKLGLAAALQQFPWLDGDRVCALGASFGGYMVNWIAGAWPDRFRCLVNHDGMFDNRMKYYSGDIIGYLEEGFGGSPYFDDPEAHEKFNPARLVDRWRTPMLVIHGGLDYRVPETQGLGAFTALQRRGIPSKFLYYPTENHWVRGSENSVQWHEEVIGWLDRWLKDE